MRTFNRLNVRWSVCEYRALAILCLTIKFAGMADAQKQVLIPGVAENHCSQILGTKNSNLLVCQVWDGRSEEFSAPRRLEVFRKGALLLTIKPASAIEEWHLWDEGRAVAMHLGAPSSYVLYSTLTGKVLATSSPMAVSSQLPEWAKSRTQRDDEAVPHGPSYAEQRTRWISKVLDQTLTLRPGMRRRQLEDLFTTEGGLSTRDQRTYVLRECRYIKIDVSFTPASSPSDSFDYDADDVIATISKPYLEFSHYD